MAKKTKPLEDYEPVKRLIDAFHAKHKTKHGCAPLRPEWGRFGKEIKGMLTSASEEELLELMDDFFATRDPRVMRCDYRPMDFVYLAQHLRLKRNGRKVVDARLSRDLDAASRATGRG